ncbi:MAG TPA: hypothetical protein DCY13_02250, partial [Verrucomicrobiales bacterium]|nr:hypothetical protein [Verrucomicrobiales bacterium]
KSDKVNGALNLLEPVRQAIEKRIAAAESKRTEQVTSLEKTVELLGAECVEAKREVEKAEQRVAELEAKLAETTPAKQLARFIEDRAASDDYRRHLGILAVIRRDFEKLARLVASQREEERKGTEPLSDPTRINRIVLYIDDLDRCPAHKVVEVLQAIHLLLAFPLFVVVVGVDSRWISRSLETTYRRLLNPPAEGDPTDEAERLPGHGATPRDYLEKIFQIPFWLRPMQAQDCRRLIGGLTEDSIGGESTVAEGVETNVGEVSPNQQPASRRAASNAGPLDRVGEAAQKAAPVRPAADDPKPKDRADAITGPASVSNAKDEPQPARTARVELMPRALNLEPQEVTFMNELTDVLTRSPRSVKRFINCYRLIKAHLRPEQLAEFVGGQTGRGDYQPVMLLLAVLNGAPAVADKFLDRLTNPHPTFAFQELVSAMDLFNAMQPSDAWTSTKQLLNAHWNSRREQAPRRRWTVHQLIEELNAFGDRSNQQDRAVARKFFESFARRMESYTLKQVADELNSDSELAGRPEWGRVHRFIHHHADSDPARNDLRPVRRAAPFVARF